MGSDRLHRVATFDVEDGVPDQPQPQSEAQAQPEKRRPGRPRGATGKTLRLDTRLQTSDFYFLRAVAQGIAPKRAADRYLAHRGPIEGREAATLARDLLEDVAQSIESLKDVAAVKTAREALHALREPAAPKPAGPSLEDFARRFEDDMYSERELIELYVDEYGAPPGTDVGEGVSAKRKVDSINWLMGRLATAPTASEPCRLWLSEGIERELRHFGVISLGDLVAWINLTGRRWYDRLDGVGRTRAARLVSFLNDHADTLGAKLSARVTAGLPGVATPESSTKSVANVVAAPNTPAQRRAFDVVPMEELSWPIALQGADGEFRALFSNGYQATDDIQAIRAWFESIQGKSPATTDNYRRSIERLVLWSILEKKKALSSLTQSDFLEFVEFLRKPPLHWCNRLPVMRSAPEWRPLRGPLQEISIRNTMSAVGTMFGAWHKVGYLRLNAVPESVMDKARKGPEIDVMRSFAVEDLELIRSTLESMEDGMEKRRLRAIILLLQTGGLRRAEAVSLTWGNVAPLREGVNISDMMGVTFVGKGNKERTVPLHSETVKALEEHYQDRLALIAAGRLRLVDQAIAREDAPLLSVLDDRLTKKDAGPGLTAIDAPRAGNSVGRLSAHRMYGILKNFFKKVSQHPDLARGNADFLKASTHWMRHTFAHHTLKASNGDLPTVQALLGHKSITTTGIYLKADQTPMAEAVRALKPSV